MLCEVPLGVGWQDSPARFPQREASRRQKYSTKRRYARERAIFFADWQSAEDEEARAFADGSRT